MQDFDEVQALTVTDELPAAWQELGRLVSWDLCTNQLWAKEADKKLRATCMAAACTAGKLTTTQRSNSSSATTAA